MKKLFTGLLIIGTISCSRTKQNDINHFDFKLNVDSVFVQAFSISELTKVEMPSDFLTTEDQRFFPNEAISFYEFSTQKLADTVDLKIILAKPAYVAGFDGELKIVFLVTIGKIGKIIDHVRVGKTESAAEYQFLETSIIENNSVRRKSDESTYEEDSINGGRRLHKLKTEIFKITDDGKINRQPT